MKPTHHFVVTGMVQGVYFRQSTRERALDLGLTGWIRNLPHGDVELIAQGDLAALDTLHQWLREGPPRARVTGVSRRIIDDDTEYRDFIVLR